MKNIILAFIFVTMGNISFGQEATSLAPDQNPNYINAMNKYSDNSIEYTSQQGTTLQETYKAINPLEEKRELRSLRRKYRSQRAYWRHQRRLARIENTRYYDYGYNGFQNQGYTWLGLGLLGSCLFW